MDNELLISERAILRSELSDLKNCQVRYFYLSITATGILIGLALKFTGSDMEGIFFLVPLLIVLPCWWIFFDKATTITRIVGYVRVLENLMISAANKADPTYRYTGWENALEEFRYKAQKKKRSLLLVASVYSILAAFWRVPKLLFTSTIHRYWVINWFTFFILSALCITLSIVFSGDSIGLQIIAGIIVWAFAGSTASVVTNLIDGDYSYNANAKKWYDMLAKDGKSGV